MGNWTVSAWPILVSAALKSTLVLGVAWMITMLLRGRSAAARHVVWTACAAALLALPLLSISIPALHLPAANGLLPADGGAVTFRATSTGAAASGMVAATKNAQGHTLPSSTPVSSPMDWRTGIVLIWAAGIVLAMLQMLAACIALWRTRRSASPSAYSALAGGLARDLGIAESVDVLEIPAGMPMTFGVLRPTVLVPSCAADWSEDRRRVVLLHELAHVRRGDAATHLLARTALAFNWWNPLAWSAWRAFLRERERAADDLVLTAGATAVDYASHLLEIARTMQTQSLTAAAAIPMARSSQLEGRLIAILNSNARRTQPARSMGLIAAVLAVALMAPLAAIRAQSAADQGLPADVDSTIMAANAQKNRDILDQSAVTFEHLRKFAEAKKLREASLALAEQISGPQSAEYAMALVHLGDLARRYGTLQESNDYYKRALSMGDRPEVFPALMRLGLTSKDPDERRNYLERARVAARNGNDAGSAMTWLAQERQDEPDGAPIADALYRGAMSLESPDSGALAFTLEQYAKFLTATDRASEAAPLQDRAKTLRKSLVGATSSRFAPIMNAVKVGGGVTAPALLYKVEPEYSEEARTYKVQGTVLLSVVIDVDGVAKNIELVNGQGNGLDEKAAEAVALWKFKPGTNGGVAVPVYAKIEVNFRLM